VLLAVSGHAFAGDPAYLRFDAGPEIESDLEAAGYTVATSYYVDGADTAGGFGGYVDLVADMAAVRDTWAQAGSRVVVVAHSHGGAWAHGAIRAVPGLPIRALVDLDCSSYGWGLVGHDVEDDVLGGDPRDAHSVGFVASWPQYPSVPSEPTGTYDLEDVVFANVLDALEVRSGDSPLGGEWYDEKWNLRASGAVDGLWAYYSGDTHEEVHAAGGVTLRVVRDWLRARLAE
jgi:hypothetical protein